jgi:hypothetical protein
LDFMNGQLYSAVQYVLPNAENEQTDPDEANIFELQYVLYGCIVTTSSY